MKKLYRYEIEYSNSDNLGTEILLREYPVIRETEFTYFIGHQYQTLEHFGRKLKRVSKKAHNTFAYDSKEKAMKNFTRRTTKRISWYKYWIEECEKGIELAKEITV